MQEAAAASGAELTSGTIEEVTAAFATLAGEDNAKRLQELLCNILAQKTAQQQQQQSSVPAQAPEATLAAECQAQPAAAAAEAPAQQQEQQQQQANMEVDLLPVEDKETRKVCNASITFPEPRVQQCNYATCHHTGRIPGYSDQGRLEHSAQLVQY